MLRTISKMISRAVAGVAVAGRSMANLFSSYQYAKNRSIVSKITLPRVLHAAESDVRVFPACGNRRNIVEHTWRDRVVGVRLTTHRIPRVARVGRRSQSIGEVC